MLDYAREAISASIKLDAIKPHPDNFKEDKLPAAMNIFRAFETSGLEDSELLTIIILCMIDRIIAARKVDSPIDFFYAISSFMNGPMKIAVQDAIIQLSKESASKEQVKKDH